MAMMCGVLVVFLYLLNGAVLELYASFCRMCSPVPIISDLCILYDIYNGLMPTCVVKKSFAYSFIDVYIIIILFSCLILLQLTGYS